MKIKRTSKQDGCEEIVSLQYAIKKLIMLGYLSEGEIIKSLEMGNLMQTPFFYYEKATEKEIEFLLEHQD